MFPAIKELLKSNDHRPIDATLVAGISAHRDPVAGPQLPRLLAFPQGAAGVPAPDYAGVPALGAQGEAPGPSGGCLVQYHGLRPACVTIRNEEAPWLWATADADLTLFQQQETQEPSEATEEAPEIPEAQEATRGSRDSKGSRDS